MSKIKKSKYRGQGMVEFALAFPIFLLLLLGIIEFGRLFIAYISVYAAAREGARYGSAVENLCDNGMIVSEARRVGFMAGNVNIVTQYEVFDSALNLIGNSCADAKAGDRIIVHASVPFTFLTGFVTAPWSGPVILQSTARRTIIKEVYLVWTLAPASTSATGPTPVPPTATTAPPPTETTAPLNSQTATAIAQTATSVAQTAVATAQTATSAVQTAVSAAQTATSAALTATAGAPQPPQVCAGEWEFIESSNTTETVSVTFTNPSAMIMALQRVSITWNTSGNRYLKQIDYKPPGTTTYRLITYGPNTSGSVTYIPDPTLGIPPGETWVVLFVFTKSNTTVFDITLDFRDSTGSTCYITNP